MDERTELSAEMRAYLARVDAWAEAEADQAAAEYERGRALERAASGLEDAS